MGRHGGGSRSGGSSRSSSSSRSRSGSRGGGSSIRTSTTPFSGCYNRSYYDRRGRYHNYYTNNVGFGTKRGWNGILIFAILFLIFHMILMLGSVVLTAIDFGNKVDGDKNRIYIEDTIDILTEEEETKILSILNDVYEKSGMPVTVYTDNFSWKDHYDYISVYSEELYYSIGYDEDAMIIVFTA